MRDWIRQVLEARFQTVCPANVASVFSSFYQFFEFTPVLCNRRHRPVLPPDPGVVVAFPEVEGTCITTMNGGLHSVQR